MKKYLFILFALVLFSAPAYGQNISIDIFGGAATEPVGDFGSTFGGGAGVNVDYQRFHKPRGRFGEVSKNIKFRADISFYRWEEDKQGLSLEYVRAPLFVGGRYYFRLNPGFALFGEGGLELSSDSVETAVCAGPVCVKDDESKLRSGAALGAGMEFGFTRRVFGSFFLRHHAIKDDYLSAIFGVGFYLNR